MSIPYNFEMRDLQPQLRKLLQGARAESISTSDDEQLSSSSVEGESDAQPADIMGDRHKSHHSREEHQKVPFMEGSASADTAGSMPADALAGAPIESPFSTYTLDCAIKASARACSALNRGLALNARELALPLAASRRNMILRTGKQRLLVSRYHCYQRHRPYQSKILRGFNTRLNHCML